MKNLLTALSVLTVGTTAGNLSSALNISAKTETVTTALKQEVKTINKNNLFNITIKNDIWKYLTRSKLETTSGGENYYNYYFFYHVIGLNHKTMTDLNNAIGSGISAVSAILCGVLPALAPIIAIVAALLIAQWYVWEIPDSDKGNGVIIDMIGGTFPQIIVNVKSQ